MSAEVSKALKGFKKQAFGIVLILFGAISTVFNIKTGIAVDAFDLFMIVLV